MTKIHKTPHVFISPLTVEDVNNVSPSINTDYSLNLSASTSGAFGLPSLSTTARNLLTGIAGMKIWNTTASEEQIYNGSAWVASGGGGGGGTGSTLLMKNLFLDPGMDSLDYVTTYDDAGDYVDGTGGSPTGVGSSTSVSPSVISGTSSLNLSLSSSVIGEGWSITTTVDDKADLNKTLFFRFDVDAHTVNDWVIGDFQVKAYQTQANAIAPIRFASGVDPDTSNLLFVEDEIVRVSGYIDIQDTGTNEYDLRLSLHVADDTGSGTAFGMRVDNFFCGIVEVPQVDNRISDWQSYTPTFTGFGTPTDVNMFYRQVGDTLHIRGDFVTGTTTATEGLVSLPSGFTIDTAKINSTADIATFGWGVQPTGGGAAGWVNDTQSQGITAFYDGVNSDSFEITNQGASDVNNSRLANALWASGERLIFPLITIPLANASSNLSVGSASTFRMAPILANGTEVSGVAPGTLGEYRPFRRDGGATTYNETTASPTAGPSVADGVRIYSTTNFAGASAVNEPSRYDIFIGLNKSYRLEWYASAGKTGIVSVDTEVNSTYARGARSSYDPSTGILSIWQSVKNTATGTTNIGENEAGAAIADPYFDIIVSENVQAIGFDPVITSMVRLTESNGYGSTNTVIRRYLTTVTEQGSDITYTDDATNGASFTINAAGMYAVTAFDNFSSAAAYLGLSLNSAQLTTSIISITGADRLAIQSGDGANVPCTANWTGFLEVGDVIRVHTSAAATAVAARAGMTIARVS